FDLTRNQSLSPVLCWARWFKWLEGEFTDRKVRGSNPTSASRLPLSRLGQTGSIPALVQPSGGMAVRHRKGATAERYILPYLPMTSTQSPSFRQPYVLLELNLHKFRLTSSSAYRFVLYRRLTWNPGESLVSGVFFLRLDVVHQVNSCRNCYDIRDVAIHYSQGCMKVFNL
ncbi:hypothetical protein CSKR_110018, partial [Clonorchis sinensis]